MSIRELAEPAAGVLGYSGGIDWVTSKPDGTHRKSPRRLPAGRKPEIRLEDGLRST